ERSSHSSRGIWRRGGFVIAWLRCFVRNHNNPVRHPLGGFKCADCGEAGADLEQMGFVDSGYVLPVRRIFSRDKGEFTRTASWEPSGRGWQTSAFPPTPDPVSASAGTACARSRAAGAGGGYFLV